VKRTFFPRPLEYLLIAALSVALLVFLVDLAITTDNERVARAIMFAQGAVAHVPAHYEYCNQPPCSRSNSFIGTEETYRTLDASVQESSSGHVVWFTDPRSCIDSERARDCNRIRVVFRGEQPQAVAFFPRAE
jgi:hypothetical protein